MKKKTVHIAKEVITTKAYKLHKDKHGIVHRHIIENAHIDIEDAKEMEQLSLNINGGKKIHTIIHANNFHTVSPEATNYFKTAQGISRVATAVVSSNLSQKIMAGFIANNSSNPPFKVFSSENEAVTWMLSLKRKV